MVINMFNDTFNIHFLIVALCVFMCAGNSNIKSCVETDKQALLKLKVDFTDDFGILSSWKQEVDCCEWNGISCNRLTGHVTKLQVPYYGSEYLKGKIDSSLCDLQHLTQLNLACNKFGGSKIPKCIGSLNQLRELNLSSAGLGGTIPHELRNLSNLQTLDIGYNYQLIANDLEWISNLSSLRHLDLSWVNLSQAVEWQSSLSRKTSQLRKLILSHANLVSISPHQLGNLSNLQTLDIGYNDQLIVNDIEWISNLPFLRHLDLSRVNLSQALDWHSSLSKMSSLLELSLDRCALPQVNPKSLLHSNYSTSLTSLSLRANYFDTSILYWVSNISKTLVEIDLSRNSFQHIPAGTFSNMNSLKSLALRSTSLQHVASDAFTNTTSLESLSLSGNDLDNDVVKAIANLCQLRVLLLDYNNLSGPLSDWMPQLHCSQLSIERLAFSYNPFHSGPFPDFSKFSYLESLALSNTSLNGLISQSLGQLPHLSELDISHNNLSGPIPHSIGYLLHLLELDISHNNLSGSIPQSLGHLPHLLELDISHNGLIGSIPQSLGHLPFLSELHISHNHLSGSLPQSLGHLSHLSELDISHNNLSGPIPQSLGHLLHLSELDISHNNLSGPIPQSLGHLPNLLELDISHNNLSGSFPKLHQLPSLEALYMFDNKLNGMVNEGHLSTLSNLKILYVSNNFLSFNFSPKWVPPFQLNLFLARSCNFSIGFPMWLKHQRNLVDLDISSGSISYSIPEWIFLLPSLFYLNMSHNKIHGEFPRSLPQFPINLDLSFNNLSGPIPQFSLPIEVLLLSNNRLSGSISTLCATSPTRLRQLDMSSNLLTGKLPHCWRQFISLEVLILANNNFSGEIPSSIGTLKKIKTIHLNNNNFSGKIPSLMNSPNLQFIDYGQNNLYGKLPTWIGHNLSNLIVLRLQSNKFHGNIPTSLCKLSVLQILDLSKNDITGSIPHCFNNLSALSNLTFPRHTISYFIYAEYSWDALFIENAMLNWKGEVVKYDKNLGLMTAIDLSDNHLTGEIPSRMTSLVALASLNLSRNNLTGFIPKNMGQMNMLESLDLSSNYISGEIPMSFSNLNFLSFLNLSFNNLSGEIPQTTQLQTFEASSYIGNHGLCGQPLTKGCAKNDDFDQDRKTSPRIDANEGDELITFGFYISMILGFLVGFWGVCGTLILKSSWRVAYFQFFTNMYDWIYVRLAIFKARMKRRFQD
ncbi:hypothetical protein K1719_011153 [Acacia pycnantha]|nr:hypothetical protein K1719_011153 [Acacia pycnantha]